MPNGASLFADRTSDDWRKGLSMEDSKLLYDFSIHTALALPEDHIPTSGILVGLGCPDMRVGDIVTYFIDVLYPYVMRRSAWRS